MDVEERKKRAIAGEYNTAWWCVVPERLVPEPDPATNKQIVPEHYSSSHNAGIASMEDYRRVVTSIGLRSLKDKTQVFALDNEHHVRTRLSHSYEVATTASSIFEEILSRDVRQPNSAKYAKEQAENQEKKADADGKREYYSFRSLISTNDPKDPSGYEVPDEQSITALRYSLMAACLLHDAGNPPFGHFGEQVISSWFRERQENGGSEISNAICDEGYCDLVNFEGNANSLRIALGSSCIFDGRRLNLTPTTILAVVKYPRLSVTEEKVAHGGKYNIFLSDKQRVEKLSKAIREKADSGSVQMVDVSKGDRHPLSFILEASDDISYVTADFEDAFRKGLFTISDVISAFADFTGGGSLGSTRKLVHLLAVLAGTDHDIMLCETLFAGKALTPLESEDACSFLEKGQKHTFRSALQALSSSTDDALQSASKESSSLANDAFQRRQLQETYVSRWVDIVRRWLRFSSAGAIGKSDIFCGSRERLEACTDIDKEIFGENYLATVEFLKEVMKKYVYNSPQNAKLNLTANTVLRDLLDRFVPAAIKCVDPVKVYDDANADMDSFQKTLMLSIPLRYRLDYKDRKREAKNTWKSGRDAYERVMMVLDYITSMTDGFAVQLHKEIC